MELKKTFFAIYWLSLTSIAILMQNCSDSKKPEESESGGDHVPQLKNYSVISLPIESTSTGVSWNEIAVPPLRPIIHLSERYYVCIDYSIPDGQLENIQSLINLKTSNVNTSGLSALKLLKYSASHCFETTAS